MSGMIEPIARMVNQLSKLPGIGQKTAQRLAYYIISLPEEQVRELAVSIFNGKKQVKFCSICGNYATEDPCAMCTDDDRKNGLLARFIARILESAASDSIDYTVDGLLKQWPNNEYRNWYLGDWAAPEGVDVQDPRSVDLVNNCSLCQVYKELEAIAPIVGRPEDAAEFRSRYEALAKRINECLYNPLEYTYGSGSQVDMAYPLLVGIVPPALVGKVRDKLFERTAKVYDGHLNSEIDTHPTDSTDLLIDYNNREQYEFPYTPTEKKTEE